jgi:hypothetical protein
MTKNINIGKAQNFVYSVNPDQDRFLNGISEILVPTDLSEASRQAITVRLLLRVHLTPI